jgi:hypothetical protein
MPAPPLPVVSAAFVSATLALGGYTAATFTDAAQSIMGASLAAQLGVSAAQVMLSVHADARQPLVAVPQVTVRVAYPSNAAAAAGVARLQDVVAAPAFQLALVSGGLASLTSLTVVTPPFSSAAPAPVSPAGAAFPVTAVAAGCGAAALVALALAAAARWRRWKTAAAEKPHADSPAAAGAWNALSSSTPAVRAEQLVAVAEEDGEQGAGPLV